MSSKSTPAGSSTGRNSSTTAGSGTLTGSHPGNLKSGVWDHFLRDSVSQTAQCKLCKTSLKTGGGSTKSLHTHLHAKHNINVLKAKHDSSTDDEDGGGSGTSKPHTKLSKSASASGSMMKYMLMKPNDSSLAATIARLTASDGLSFRVFAKSTDMRRLFAQLL